MRRIFPLALGFFLTISVFFATAFCVRAQADNEPTNAESGIQVSPNRFDWVLEDGETRTGVIHLHNYDDISHDVTVEVEDFFVKDETFKPEFYVPDESHERKAFDVINWFEKPDDFTLGPHESKRVEFKVHVPENQPTNGYYGAIFFKTRAPDIETTNDEGTTAKIKVDYRVGTIITLAVRGDEPFTVDGTVKEFSVGKNIFWESPITLTTKLLSSGNIHYKVGGTATINRFGKVFSEIQMDDKVLYPGIARTFTNEVPFGIWDFGKYNAVLQMQSEDGSVKFDSVTPDFYVIPWQGALIVLGAIILLIIIILFMKNYVRIEKKQPKKKKKK